MTASDNAPELSERGELKGEPGRPGPAASPGAPDSGPAPEEPRSGHRRRNSRRTALSVAGVVVVATAAGLAATGALGGGGGDPTATAATQTATAKVERTTLKDTVTVDGELGYGDVSSVAFPGGGSGASFLTWVPESGDVIRRGETVYRVNQQKIPLLYGNIPIYRTLAPGDSGSDVKILEKNLKALGYDGFTADSDYTWSTAAAVKDWQDDLNRDETGEVRPGDAVVASGPRTVSDVKGEVGSPPGGVVLSWTGTERLITMDLDAQYEDLIKVGTRAEVELPDGSTVQARVTHIGAPSNSGAGAAKDDQDADQDATLPVELEVSKQKGLGEYQAASVDVVLESKARKDVLAVPISALVARTGGGYALQVSRPSAPNGVAYLPVEVGMFSDSMVEVKGAGVTEGIEVAVPR